MTYDETFVTILEKSLQEIQPGTEVVNLGVIGFEPEHELHLVQHYGIHLHPDLVMLNVFVGNDIIRKRGADTEEALRLYDEQAAPPPSLTVQPKTPEAPTVPAARRCGSPATGAC